MNLPILQSEVKTMSSREIVWLNTEKANDLLKDPCVKNPKGGTYSKYWLETEGVA